MQGQSPNMSEFILQIFMGTETPVHDANVLQLSKCIYIYTVYITNVPDPKKFSTVWLHRSVLKFLRIKKYTYTHTVNPVPTC